MNRPLLPLLAVALFPLFVGPIARGDDPKPAEAKKTFEIRLRERWKAGDVITRSAKESMSRHVETKRADETPKQLPGAERLTSYVVVTKCLEADAEGYATKFLLYLVAWSVESGAEKDSSLAGVHVEVTGVGANRAWKILTPDAKPSAAARTWIDQFYGPKSSGDATYHDLEPKGPVEIGVGWQGDAHAIAKRLADRGIAVDVEKSKALCTLLGVEDGREHIQIKMTFPTTELRLPNGQALPWKEGGLLELDLDITRPGVEGAFDAKVRREQKLAGVATGDDVAVTWEDLGSQDIEVHAGGKMPDIPTAPPEGAKQDPAGDAPMGDK